MVSIGIDLGTTNSCVAVYRDGSVEILGGKTRTTPSVVGFLNNEIVIGNDAKKYLSRFPESIIYDAKRIIGLDFNDPIANGQCFPFKLINSGNKVKIAIAESAKVERYSPEEISAFLLRHLKCEAEAEVCGQIDDVVITVPTYFNDAQRQATIDAGKIAGFKKINLLNEPTAAAIHYGIYNRISDGRIILVYDFGGGTFDVSIIKYSADVFQVIDIDGDPLLGGEDIDDKLMQHIKKFIKIDDPNGNSYKRTMARLKAICEDAKIELSSKTSTDFELFGFDSTQEEITMTREEFETLIEDIIEKTMQIVEKCISGHEIDDILLIGGSTRIPKIRSELLKRFNYKPKMNVNADEAVAAGAAIYAAKLYNGQFQKLQTINICQHSLGVETQGGKMSFLIEKYQKLPAKATKCYQTVRAHQSAIDINIFCGDHSDIKNNRLLGKLEVTGIKSADGIVEETFEVDENGILKVSAVDEDGESKELIVNLQKGNLTDEEIAYCGNRIKGELKRSQNFNEFMESKRKLQIGCKKKWLADLKYSEENLIIVQNELINM